MNAYLYIEGGGDSKELKSRCREGFSKLLAKCGVAGRMPSLIACGGRDAVFNRFKIELGSKQPGDYVAMLIDSEEPMRDIEAAWTHLQNVQTVAQWDSPDGAEDDQVLFMTTCMETWFLADQSALKAHYENSLQESALTPLKDLEARNRFEVQDSLIRATRNCPNAYAKGPRSFKILAKVSPDALKQHLPSFVRGLRILEENL